MMKSEQPARLQETLKIITSYGLERKHMYLLELMPLIDIMWADGKNQSAEVRLIYWYAVKHLSRLYDAMPHLEDQLRIEECNSFLERFCEQERPDQKLLKSLCQLADREAYFLNTNDLENRQKNREETFSLCAEIAAAAVAGEDEHQCACHSSNQERILEEERVRLLELARILVK